jgi:hypothetical protein
MKVARGFVSPWALAGVAAWIAILGLTANWAIPVFANVGTGPQCPAIPCPPDYLPIDWVPVLGTAAIVATLIVAVLAVVAVLVRRLIARPAD